MVAVIASATTVSKLHFIKLLKVVGVTQFIIIVLSIGGCRLRRHASFAHPRR